MSYLNITCLSSWFLRLLSCMRLVSSEVRIWAVIFPFPKAFTKPQLFVKGVICQLLARTIRGQSLDHHFIRVDAACRPLAASTVLQVRTISYFKIAVQTKWTFSKCKQWQAKYFKMVSFFYRNCERMPIHKPRLLSGLCNIPHSSFRLMFAAARFCRPSIAFLRHLNKVQP
jgi:hypothetical protein